MVHLVVVALLVGALVFSGVLRLPERPAPARPPRRAPRQPMPAAAPAAVPAEDRAREQRQIRQLAERLTRLEAAFAEAGAPAAPSPPASATAGPSGIVDTRHRVLSLARRGKDPASIARQLGLSQSEVELIVRLGGTRTRT
jgi:hypothetical protein